MQNKSSGASSPPLDAYATKYGKAFATPECIRAYPPIYQDTIDQNQKLETVRKIQIKDYSLYNTGVRGASVFILAVVDDVWVCEIRDTTTFYTDVLPSSLLKHLEDCCTGLYAIDTIKLPLIIQGYYTDASNMTVYVIMLKDAHYKSYSTDTPLSNATILATETQAIFASQEYSEKSC